MRAPHSDYDVAVKVGRRLSPQGAELIYSAFSRCVGGQLDLVVLDDWDSATVREALACERPVYSRDPGCVREYYKGLTRAIDELAGLECLIRVFSEAVCALSRPNG